MTLTEALAIARGIPHEEIWRILHEECGAPGKMDEGFPIHWPECREYRFCGALGFGSKIYADSDRWRVGCNPEHSTPKRSKMIVAADVRLMKLYARAIRQRGEPEHGDQA